MAHFGQNRPKIGFPGSKMAKKSIFYKKLIFLVVLMVFQLGIRFVSKNAKIVHFSVKNAKILES